MKFRVYVFVLFLVLYGNSCSHRPHVKSTQVSHQFLATAAVDSSVYKILQPYKVQHDQQMTEIVAVCEEVLNKDVPEGALGNFVTDCILRQIKPELIAKGNKEDVIVVLNNGGLRVSLPQGEITRGKIFELMPFDNELMLIRFTGKEMDSLVRFIAAKGGMPIAGMRMEIDAKKRPVNVTVNGAELDTLKTYNVITSDYLGGGGDNMTFFRDARVKESLRYLIRDQLLEYCRQLYKQNKSIGAKTDGRISFSK